MLQFDFVSLNYCQNKLLQKKITEIKKIITTNTVIILNILFNPDLFKFLQYMRNSARLLSRFCAEWKENVKFKLQEN